MYLRAPADLGALIRERRRAKKLDQRTLAERVGVSRQWIIEVERGKPGAALGLVLKTLAALGIELSASDDDGGGADGDPTNRTGSRTGAGARARPKTSAAAPVFVPDVDAIIRAARKPRRR